MLFTTNKTNIPDLRTKFWTAFADANSVHEDIFANLKPHSRDYSAKSAGLAGLSYVNSITMKGAVSEFQVNPAKNSTNKLALENAAKFITDKRDELQNNLGHNFKIITNGAKVLIQRDLSPHGNVLVEDSWPELIGEMRVSQNKLKTVMSAFFERHRSDILSK